MSKELTKLVIAVGLVLAPVAYAVWWVFFPSPERHPSLVIDFRPTSFEEKTDSPFFYSIGDELKFSTRIDIDSPTIYRGKITRLLVSPDNTKALLVSDGRLIIADAKKRVFREITPVHSIWIKPKPVGESFFRDAGFQWSKNSKFIYLIKDEFYESEKAQLFSKNGALWRYSLDSEEFEKVLSPFRAYQFFLGLMDGVYFSVPDEQGNLILKYFDGAKVHEVGAANRSAVDFARIHRDFVDKPFYSFSFHDYQTSVLRQEGVKLEKGGKDVLEFRIKGSTILEFSRGEGFKGPYFGVTLFQSVFLPGNRYFLINTHAGNHHGQILIDTQTGRYRALPKETRVYPRMNLDVHTGYCVTGAGIEIRSTSGACG